MAFIWSMQEIPKEKHNLLFLTRKNIFKHTFGHKS